jgi:hypothetical protein
MTFFEGLILGILCGIVHILCNISDDIDMIKFKLGIKEDT